MRMLPLSRVTLPWRRGLLSVPRHYESFPFFNSVPFGHGEVEFGSVLLHLCTSSVQVEHPFTEISLCSFIACLPCPHLLLILCLGIYCQQLSPSNIQSVVSNVRVGVAGKSARDVDVQSLNGPLLRESIAWARLSVDAPTYHYG